MLFSQKYCLVQLFKPLEVSAEFSSVNWPLHVTIAGVFALDWNHEYFAEFAALIKQHQPFSSKTTSIEHFGPKQDVKVRLIKQTEKLQSLHSDVANFIVDHGGVFNSLQYQFDGFRPHATMRGENPGENITVTFSKLALIDMYPDMDHTKRRVIQFFALSHN